MAPIKFKILVQLADDGDVVDDATVHWPENRTQHESGTISLSAPVPDSDHEQKQIIFDPMAPRRWNCALRRSLARSAGRGLSHEWTPQTSCPGKVVDPVSAAAVTFDSGRG